MTEEISFKTPKKIFNGQLRASIIFLPLLLFTMVVIVINILEKLNKNDTVDIILLIIILLVCMYGFYILVLFTRNLYTMAYSITLIDDRVIAWNIKKKIREIKYDEIEKIIKHEKNNTIVLVTAGGSLELSADIEDYGSCIEAIRVRSNNVKSVDYGGLDKKDNIWKKRI